MVLPGLSAEHEIAHACDGSSDVQLASYRNGLLSSACDDEGFRIVIKPMPWAEGTERFLQEQAGAATCYPLSLTLKVV